MLKRCQHVFIFFIYHRLEILSQKMLFVMDSITKSIFCDGLQSQKAFSGLKFLICVVCRTNTDQKQLPVNSMVKNNKLGCSYK